MNESNTEQKHHIGCGYLSDTTSLKGLSKRVREVVSLIKQVNPNFSSIAFRGFSGSLVGPTAALRLKKEFLMVRKDVNGSHSSYGVEGILNLSNPTYIIVDDFVSSGVTVQRIVQTVARWLPTAKCVGVFTYSSRNNSDFSELRVNPEVAGVEPYYVKVYEAKNPPPVAKVSE